jgi:hypothetical protein
MKNKKVKQEISTSTITLLILGIIARCSANKSILTSEKCDRPLCKNCVVKKGNKYFCEVHR